MAEEGNFESGVDKFGDYTTGSDYNSPEFNVVKANAENDYWNSNHVIAGTADFESLQEFDETQSLGHSSRNLASSQKFTRRSQDDSFVGDLRSNRIAHAEAMIRQEMFKDCTFQPKIKPLPGYYGGLKDSGAPFHARVTKWHKDREIELRNKTKKNENIEVAECTFQPKINRNSDRAVKELRGAAAEPASERLFKSSSLQLEHRYKAIEEERAKEQKKELEECTFQPKLRKNHIYDQVNSRIYKSTAGKLEPKDPDPPLSKSKYPFTPKVNKLKPGMSSAKMYLKTNVVDRLSRPNNSTVEDTHLKSAENSLLRTFDDPSTAHDSRPIIDMASFMNNLSVMGSSDDINIQSGVKRDNFMTPKTMQRRNSTGGNAGFLSVNSSEDGQILTEEEKIQKKKNFERFIARQALAVEERKQTLKKMEESMTPKFKPKITKKSKELVGDQSKFSNRVEKYIQKRQQMEQNVEVEAGKEYTFKPKINKKAEKLRARTSFEMSRGDLLRKETHRRILQLQTEQKDSEQFTFKPTLSERAKQATSKLQLNSEDSSQFLKQYEKQNSKKEWLRLQAQKEKEERELQECTFAPETTECPAYVRRIAKSMSIVKAARSSGVGTENSQTTASKPDWR